MYDCNVTRKKMTEMVAEVPLCHLVQSITEAVKLLCYVRCNGKGSVRMNMGLDMFLFV